jgi:hypothetical protein
MRNEELYNLYASIIVRDFKVKEDVIGRECSRHMKEL